MLWKAAFNGLTRRYHPVSPEVINRLTYELSVINTMGFAEYFLIAKDIVDYCCSQGVPCIGRGSAADSLVSYVLGITHADPIRYNLYFERFLNPERREPPDIDLDICWKRRDDVLQYIYSTYGVEKTAMICTINTFQLRSAISDAGKAYGLSEDEVRQLTRSLPHRSVEYIDTAVEKIPECRNHSVTDAAYKEILAVSRLIAGFPRHLSVHPGGVIMAPDDITKYTALEVSGKGIVISQHDMHAMEKLGLVKMDILGVRGLSVIADCLRETTKIDNPTGIHPFGKNNHSGIIPSIGNRTEHSVMDILRSVPENDSETMQMIMGGKTVGCFQIESPAMRGLLKKMQVSASGGVEDVINAIAVIRPGPSEGGMSVKDRSASGGKDAFIRRRAGIEKTTYLHPLLESVLKDTYGIVVYQEQVLQIASIIAGFSYGEADILRRAMTKSRTRETIQPLREKFIAGAKQKNISEETAQDIWQFLEHFTGYGFNKAHSATYGILAYQSAYLKYHYPVPFMTAVLNNGGGFYSLCEYIEEARRLGITIEPPDVTKAEYFFTHTDTTIVSGLYPVCGLFQKSINAITTERNKEPFRDVYDFLARTGVQEAEAVSLAKSGAFRSLHNSEPETLIMVKAFFRNGRKSHIARRLTETVSLPPYTLPQRIIAELETLKFAVSAHPLSLFSELECDPVLIPAVQLGEYKDKTVNVAGWMVTSRRAPTKDGKYIKFATLEDKTGLFEAVLFPDIYDKYGAEFTGYGPFRIRGTVQSRVPGESNLIVESVHKVRPKHLGSAEIAVLERDISDTMFFDAA
jgi:DNA-directed DNA polymerase III PolC